MGVASAKLGAFAAVRSLVVSCWRYLLSASFALLLVTPLFRALDQISPQPSLKHQFWFAGYYAAIAKGFCSEVGLGVRPREDGADIDARLTIRSAFYGGSLICLLLPILIALI